jgi:hypothetical protein
MAWKFRHTPQLRTKFGPEYDHLVEEKGSPARAEKELEYRSKRVEKFHIRQLTREESADFAAKWRTAQERFVDDPRGAVAEADRLVQGAMEARGYPTGGDFDERAADLSVDHAALVDNYRAGHAIAVRDSRGRVDTEDLRNAMKHYRALFEDLLDQRVSELREVRG